ncbi:hypothetical protein KA005_73720, partial [bacterium]|nr:hypothetical protein [bacterium]
MPKLLLKRTSYIVLIFALILGSFLINVSETNAQEGGMAAPKLMRAVLEMFPGLGITVKAALTIGKAITESFAGQMLEGMAYLIWVGTSWFLAVCANLFSNALDFTAQQLSQSPVYTGWTISRDIVNMFFILGLIVIAFATILR